MNHAPCTMHQYELQGHLRLFLAEHLRSRAGTNGTEHAMHTHTNGGGGVSIGDGDGGVSVVGGGGGVVVGGGVGVGGGDDKRQVALLETAGTRVSTQNAHTHSITASLSLPLFRSPSLFHSHVGSLCMP